MRLWDRVRTGLHAFTTTATESSYASPGRAAGFQRIFDRGAEIMDAADEVAAEQRGAILLVSQHEPLPRWLLGKLREQPPIPPGANLQCEGFFTLATLPLREIPPGESDPPTEEAEPASWDVAGDPLGNVLQTAAEIDMILYLAESRDGEAVGCGWSDSDHRLYSRLRSTGAPILPVLVIDGSPARCEADRTRLRQRLGLTPAVVTTAPPTGDASAPDDLVDLVNRMLSLRPRLAIPLAQEAVFCRRLIATRVIRTGALIAGLVGAEPIPLLDLPLQVAVQWKVALQLAAIFGRPGLDVRSKEMAGAVGANLIVRYAAQQLAKLVPVIGWLISGMLSGASTWLLGHALLRYYENDQVWSWDATRHAWSSQVQRVTEPAHVAATAGKSRLANAFHVLNWRHRRQPAAQGAAPVDAPQATSIPGDEATVDLGPGAMPVAKLPATEGYGLNGDESPA